LPLIMQDSNSVLRAGRECPGQAVPGALRMRPAGENSANLIRGISRAHVSG